MIRKLLLPLAAGVLLAGCVTSAPYGYRDGDRGDYYYGRPSVEYRHYGPYGYDPYYGPYRPGLSIYGRIGSPYGYYGNPYYGGGYYGHPYYGGGYYGHPYYGRPRYVQPRPGPDGSGGTDNRPDIGEGGGWRNIDEIRRRRTPMPGVTGNTAQSDFGGMPRREPRVDAGGFGGGEPRSESPRMRNGAGSGFGDMIRRTQEARDTGVRQQEE
ncbi:hypothetical protein [Lysobacter humi (ex Lee et al. 2017)]